MIWCVEDDASILDIEVYTLQSTGFQAQASPTAGLSGPRWSRPGNCRSWWCWM